MTKPKPKSVRECVECGAHFETSHPNQTTCSTDCCIERHARQARAHAAKNYAPRGTRPLTCTQCSKVFERRGNKPGFCSNACKVAAQTERRYGPKRTTRPCRRCGTDVPNVPGIAVCAGCKVDKRDPEKARAKEKARRFRRYGISEDEFDDLLARQGGRCAICKTTQPGGKGWAIDHCHEAGGVRAVLCPNCNAGIGFMKHDERILSAAATYVHEHRQLRLVV